MLPLPLPLPLPLLMSRQGSADNDECPEIPENTAVVDLLFACLDNDSNGGVDGEEVEVEMEEE